MIESTKKLCGHNYLFRLHDCEGDIVAKVSLEDGAQINWAYVEALAKEPINAASCVPIGIAKLLLAVRSNNVGGM